MANNIITKIITRIKNKPPFIGLLFLLIFGICFGFITVFGFGNSSFSVSEKQIFQSKNQFGQYLHIRYHLSNYPDSKRQSLISPINSFNNYRIHEVGRNASFVSEQNYSIQFNGKDTNCNYIVFGDYYSEYYSLNRFGLFQGSFVMDEFNSPNSIYISLGVAKQLQSSSLKDLLGKTIMTSLDDKEFVIKGIIDESNYFDSPIHFSNLFGNMFVLFNTSHLSNYGFTDILFESDDNTFVADSIEMTKSFKKSYINYYEVVQSISAYKEGAIKKYQDIIFSNPVSMKQVFISIVSIFFAILFSIPFLAVSIMNIYRYPKSHKNVLLFTINALCCCSPLFVLFLSYKLGLYISNISIIVSISFLVVSLAFSLIPFIQSYKGNEEDLYEG